MARTNTKKSAFFLKSGNTVPTAPAGYLELEEALIPAVDIPIEEFKRINGRLGSNDSYADTCHATISQTVSHKIREQNAVADALETIPEFGELLKIGGFDETIDTSTVGEETVIYTNTQTTTRGSALIYVDGWKQVATGSLAADLTFNFPIGKTPTISAAIQAFLDNKGVAVASATPDVSGVQSEEACMVVGCSDIVTAGGSTITPDNISISMGAEIQEQYGMGVAEYEMTDYMIKITADFFPDNADFNTAVTKLNSQTVEAIDIKVGTVAGALVSGKSMHVTADLAKANSFSDSGDKDALKRSFTWLIPSNGTLSLAFGYFA